MCLEMLGRILEIRTTDNGTPETDATAVPDRTAVVDVDSVPRRVSLAVLDLEGTEVAPGDWILSHTGLALRVLNKTEAMKLRDQRHEMYADLDAASPPENGQPRIDGAP